jgi:hypothetical protein
MAPRLQSLRRSRPAFALTVLPRELRLNVEYGAGHSFLLINPLRTMKRGAVVRSRMFLRARRLAGTIDGAQKRPIFDIVRFSLSVPGALIASRGGAGGNTFGIHGPVLAIYALVNAVIRGFGPLHFQIFYNGGRSFLKERSICER